MAKMTYFFAKDSNHTEKIKKSERRNILGGKGTNLAEMARIGVPVPPGFIITTDSCKSYSKTKVFPKALDNEIPKQIKQLEKNIGRKLGSATKPLLVSVRSGAPVSMPGMMDTILNLGLNKTSIAGMIAEGQNEHFVLDSYRRFLQMYSNVILEIPLSGFEKIIERHKIKASVKQDFELPLSSLREIITEYKKLIQEKSATPFPEDTKIQLRMAIEAIFRSWNNDRAIHYRRINNISHDLGTAVIIQAMVFGNMQDGSGTGVAFTRNPSTGENILYGEYLLNAQGEDVVAGIRTPSPISALKEEMPEVFAEFYTIQNRLEEHFKDMQDIEFTVQQKKLYILQTRSGKRTGIAAIRIATEMVQEGKIDKKTALMQVDPASIPSLLTPTFITTKKDEAIKNGNLIAMGLNAVPGAGSGQIVFSSELAAEWSAQNKKVILVREETSPEDIIGMEYANGILTARGGMTSHAAVVARGMNKPCIVGCSILNISEKDKIMSIETGDKKISFKEGDQISIDGSTGEIIKGSLPTQSSEIEQYLNGDYEGESKISESFLTLMSWADEIRHLSVRANADTPRDAKVALNYGASGIGLCRTEHMFFSTQRILLMRQMIIASTDEERLNALEQLLIHQKEDFKAIFKVMDGFPVTIRLLDPPLHEFLPHNPEEYKELSKKTGRTEEEIKQRSLLLREVNPMLGHRGCRLGITSPEVTTMQVRAILSAAIEMNKEGVNVFPEIMIPLVGHEKELELQRKLIDDVATELMQKLGQNIDYLVGTMIEVPRAALQADKIAKHAQFFSFGTNDLTQTTLAFSRDDSASFLNQYIDLGIYKNNPFQIIDRDGVGELIKIAIERGKKTKADLKIGICGEHGSDPYSVNFFHEAGLNYVSCSPFRVPIARLAAAQAKLSK